MKILTEAEFNRQLTCPATGYLFFGDEDYTKQHALRRLREAICPDDISATFNDIRLTALEFSPSKLVDMLEPLPMMGERKIISVTGLSFVSRRPEEINALCDALSALADYDYNTLVICVPEGNIDAGRLPKAPSSLLKRLSNFLTPVHFERITPARLSGWVGKHFEHNGVVAPPQLCAKVVDYCGTSMFALANEIDKISFYIKAAGRDTLSEGDIYTVAVADTSYDAFDFANSITSGDRRRALNILAVMKQRKIEPPIIMGELTTTFCNMLSVRRLMDDGLNAYSISGITGLHSYRVSIYMQGVANISTEQLQGVIDMCVEADAAVKSFGNGYEAIERLICGF